MCSVLGAVSCPVKSQKYHAIVAWSVKLLLMLALFSRLVDHACPRKQFWKYDNGSLTAFGVVRRGINGAMLMQSSFIVSDFAYAAKVVCSISARESCPNNAIAMFRSGPLLYTLFTA